MRQIVLAATLPQTFTANSKEGGGFSRAYSCALRRFLRSTATPAKPAPRSATVAGSGAGFRPGAVICPLPAEESKVTWPGVGGPEGRIDTPLPVKNPLAPAKIPAPPKIVSVFVNFGKPRAFGGPKVVKLVPINVSAPPLKTAEKLFITATGTKAPEGSAM